MRGVTSKASLKKSSVKEFLAIECFDLIGVHQHMKTVYDVFGHTTSLKPIKTCNTAARKWLKTQDCQFFRDSFQKRVYRWGNVFQWLGSVLKSKYSIRVTF